MKNPTSQQVETLVQNFKTVLPLTKNWLGLSRKNHLNMREGRVKTLGYECGTTHCHAGWYALAVFNPKVKPYIDHDDGVHAILQTLGFETYADFEYWLDLNPKLWGNPHGTRMFTSKHAFKSPKRPNGALNLGHIIDHWQEVAQRLKALERAENPQN